MNLIPVPELMVALVVGLIVLAARAFWRVRPSRLAPLEGAIWGSRQGGGSPEQVRVRLIASCVLLALVGVPLILNMVPPNGVYGFRAGGTQSSRALWYPANAFMGWSLVAAAVVSATLQVVLPGTVKRWLLWAAFLVPVFGAVLASFAYLGQLRGAV